MADELEKNGHKGIYFFIGQRIEKFKRDVIELLNRGHQIGNHSWSHLDYSKLSLDKALEETKKTDEKLREVLSISNQDEKQKLLFRYPFGKNISSDFRQDFLYKLRELNYHIPEFGWDIDTKDWHSEISIQDIVLKSLQTKENQILLLHERKKL